MFPAQNFLHTGFILSAWFKKSECCKKNSFGPGVDSQNLGMLEWQILFPWYGHQAEIQGSEADTTGLHWILCVVISLLLRCYY